jgi:hypothetical protein
MDDDLLERSAAWPSIPLCCRYCSVRFETLPVWTSKHGAESAGKLLWALGVLTDGECEVLGVWALRMSGAALWSTVFGELKSRGVVRLGAVVSGELTIDPTSLRRAYPNALALDSPLADLPMGRDRRPRLVRSGITGHQRDSVAPSPSQHAGVLAGEGVAKRLQSRAAFATARHGAFTNLEAASAFVIATLRHEEQKVVGLHEQSESGSARGSIIPSQSRSAPPSS